MCPSMPHHFSTMNFTWTTPTAQKQSDETFACENGGGELHVVEEGVKAERILEGVVVVDKNAIESPTS